MGFTSQFFAQNRIWPKGCQTAGRLPGYYKLAGYELFQVRVLAEQCRL